MTTPATNPAPHAQLIETALRTLQRCTTIATRVATLKAHESDLLKKVCIQAYSPYIRFGIKLAKTDEYELIGRTHRDSGLDIDDDEIWMTLEQMSLSTASSGAKLSTLQGLFNRLHQNTGLILIGVLNKSVVANVSASTINKAWPASIPVFSVQLAQKYTDRKVRSYPQFVEIKYDGVRAAGVIHPSGHVEVKTRTGRDIPAAAYFYDELRCIGQAYAAVVDVPAGRPFVGCVTDGELTGDTFNDAVSIFRSDAPATTGNYQVFDILPMAALTDEAYQSDEFQVRRETLRQVIAAAQTVAASRFAPMTKVLMSKSYIVNSKEETWNMYYAARADNQEGVIVKSPTGLWERKRSNAWLKIKAEETMDLRVIGAFEGEGEKEGTLGGLIVDLEGVEVRVGSGYTDKVSDELWAMFMRDLQRHTDGEDPSTYELIGCLAEVQYQEITPAGSLRHPVFVRLRKDKNEVSF